MTHQVVKKDVRGLGWQISNVEQELPKHVHQLVLVQKPNKWTNNKKLIASLFPTSVRRCLPTCLLLTVSFSRKWRRTRAGSSMRQFQRICWATALTEETFLHK